MAITYGLTDQGFVKKSRQVIVAELEAAWRLAFGASIDTSPSTPDGQFINIFAEREASLWEVLSVLLSMFHPDKARGILLDALCLITGTYRDSATRSTVMLTLTGDNGTAVGSGAQASTVSTKAKFVTQELATFTLATAWSTSASKALGDYNSANGRIYLCIAAGLTAPSGTGPSTTAQDITDGTVHWRYIGEGLAYDIVIATGFEVGPVVAVSGDITFIETPSAGWSSVCNVLDAKPGTIRMSDQSLRILREVEIAASGNSPIPAIRRAVSRVDGVESVTVFYNNTDHTNGDGIPSHSVEVMVEGGADAEIYQALFASVAGGIGYFGTNVGTVTDSQGTAHEIKFTRPTSIPIYITAVYEIDEGNVPDDIENTIKLAIKTWGDTQGTGHDVRSSLVAAQGFEVGEMVLGNVSCFIGLAPSPVSSATIAIALRERPVYDTSRINVTINAVTP